MGKPIDAMIAGLAMEWLGCRRAVLAGMLAWTGAMFAFGAPAQASCETGEEVIKLGYFTSAADPARQRAATLLRDAVNKELQGKACLQFVESEEQFKGVVGITALQSNTANMLAPSFSTLSGFAPAYGLFDKPFAFRDLDAVERFEMEALPLLVRELDNRGVVPISFWHGHFEQIAAQKPVLNPQDAAGLKLRREEADNFPAMISLLKATANSVPPEGLAEALKNGQVEALFDGWSALETQGGAKALGHVSQTNHRFVGYQLVVQKLWWTRLDDGLRKNIAELIARTSRQANFEVVNKSMGARRSLMRAGVKIWDVTQQQRHNWQRVLAPIGGPVSAKEPGPFDALLSEANAGL